VFEKVEDSVDLLIENFLHLSLSSMISEVPDIEDRRFCQPVIVATIN